MGNFRLKKSDPRKGKTKERSFRSEQWGIFCIISFLVIITRFFVSVSSTVKVVNVNVITYLGWCPAGPVLPHEEKVPL